MAWEDARLERTVLGQEPDWGIFCAHPKIAHQIHRYAAGETGYGRQRESLRSVFVVDTFFIDTFVGRPVADGRSWVSEVFCANEFDL